VGEVTLEPTLLHALTETGLETYTLKSGGHTVMEAERLDGKTSACPAVDADSPICLVGLRPFPGARNERGSPNEKIVIWQDLLYLRSCCIYVVARGFFGESGKSVKPIFRRNCMMNGLNLLIW
jgi:hypothetical protein